MASDKMVSDIRSKIANMGNMGKKYASSSAKLFLNAGTEMVGLEMPALTGMVDTNKELLNDVVRFFRNPADVINKQVDRALATDDFKSIQRVVKNAIDDLKTGELYDPTRTRTEYGSEIDNLLNSFGGVDMTGFDENGEWSDTNTQDESIETDIKIAAAQEASSTARTQATISAIGGATEAITQNQNANSQTNIKLLIKQHSQSMSSMQNLITSQAATFTAMNANFTAMMQLSKEAHTQVVGELTQMKTLLTEIRDGVKPKSTERPYKDQHDIFGPHGELDIKQYLKQVVKQADERSNISGMLSMATMGTSISTLMDSIADNPWSVVASLMLGQIVPDKTKKAMRNTNKNIANFFPALIQKLSDRGRQFDNGSGKMTDYLAKLFGIDTRSRAMVDTTTRDLSAQAAFTNRTAIAIERVIPMLLSRIDSHISGQDPMVYDYASGRLVKAADTISSYEHSMRDLVGKMGESANVFMNRASSYNFKTDAKAKHFRNYAYKYLQKQAEGNGFINPYQSKEDFMKSMPSAGAAGDDNLYYNLIYGILSNMPRDQLMQFGTDINEARRIRDRRSHETNKDLRENGLISAWGGLLDDRQMYKISSATMESPNGLNAEDLKNLNKEYRNEVKRRGGYGATNLLLDDILGTLKRGIITFSYGIGHAEGSSDDVRRLFESVKRASDRQLSGEEKILNDALKLNQNRVDRERIHLNEVTKSMNDPNKRLKQTYVDSGTTSNMASLIQKDYAASVTARGESNNPEVELWRGLIDSGKNKVRKSLDEMNLSEKTKLLGKTAFNTPFNMVTKGLQVMDMMMFKLIYGEDAVSQIEKTGEPSLISVMSNVVRTQFLAARDWFKQIIGDPIQKRIFDKDSGVIGKIGKSISNRVSPFTGAIKTRAKKFGSMFDARFRGTQDNSGKWTGGLFSGAMNSYTDFEGSVDEKVNHAIDRLLYGDYATSKGVRTSFQFDASGKLNANKAYGGVIGNLRHGFDKFSTWLLGDDKDNDSHKKFELFSSELKTSIPGMAGGALKGFGTSLGLGVLTGLWLPGGPLMGGIIGSGLGFIKSSEAFKTFLFGESFETEEKDANGMPTGKKIKRRKGNLIDSNVYEGLKKYVPKVSTGAGIGAALGGIGLLPFGMGPLVGGIFGSMGGMMTASDEIKKLIFGNPIDPKSGLISKEFRSNMMDSIKTYAPTSLAGALAGNTAWNLISGIGLIPGLSLLPGGPIFTALGAITGGVKAQDIQKFLLGETIEKDELDENKKPTGRKIKERQGGVFGKLFDTVKNDVVTPMANRVNNAGKRIEKWFNDNILESLRNSIDPLKSRLKEAGSSILNSFNIIGDKISSGILRGMGVDTEGKTSGEFFKTRILEPMGRMADRTFDAIGKIIGSIISAPFKALEFIVAGTIGGKTPEERQDAKFAQRRTKNKERRANRFSQMRNRWSQTKSNMSSRWASFRNGGLKGKIPKNAKDAFGGVFSSATTASGVIPLGGSMYSPGTFMDQLYSTSMTSRIPDQYGYDVGDYYYNDESESNIRNKIRDMSAAEQKRYRESLKEPNEHIARPDEEYNSKNTRRKSHKSDNEYLQIIAKNTKHIYDEMKGQINGVGWNTAYIKTMLAKQYGPLTSEEMPEEMEGSSRTIRKRRGFIGKAADKAKEFFGGMFGGIGQRVAGGARAFRGGVSKAFDYITFPFQLLIDGASFAGKALSGFGKGVLSVLGDLKDIVAAFLKGAAKGLGDVLAGAGSLIKNTAIIAGTGLKDGFTALTGVLKEGTLGVASILGGFLKTIGEALPDLGHLAWAGIKGIGKAAGRGIVGAGRWLGKGVTNAVGAVTGRKIGSSESFRVKKKYIGSTFVEGGTLDSIKDLIPMGLQGVGRIIPFPFVNMFNGFVKQRPRVAIPVYIAGSDSHVTLGGTRTVNPQNKTSTTSVANVSRFKRNYFKVDNAAENSRDAADVYDKAIQTASSMDEIQAIQTAQQMNANNKMMAVTSPTNEKSSGGILEFLMSLFGGGGKGVLSTIGTALGATALGKTAMSLGSKIIGGGNVAAGVLGSLGSGLALPVLGTTVAAMTGNTEGVVKQGSKTGVGLAGNIARLIGRNSTVLGGLNKVGENLLTNTRSSTSISKILESAGGTATKLFNTTVAKKIIPASMRTTASKIVSIFKTKLGTVLAGLTKTSLEQFAKKANLIVYLATATYDLASGAAEAANIMKIDGGSVTLGMRAASGVAKSLSGLAFGLIPVSWLAEEIYKIFAGKEKEDALTEAQNSFRNQADMANMSLDDYNSQTNKTVFKTVTEGTSNFFTKIKDYFTNGGWNSSNPNWDTTASNTGKGPGMKHFSQRSGQWNKTNPTLANAGCGPTAAAMVATAYGRGGPNPSEADSLSYMTGMRAADGGTNPQFFSQYASMHGYGMQQGPNDGNMVYRNLSKGQPVVMMGKGGAFGNNMHYLVGESISNRGSMNVIDPLTGNKSSTGINNIMKNTKNTIYSFGRGLATNSSEMSNSTSTSANSAVSKSQNALVNKMKSVIGKLRYSLAGSEQDPDKGVASCASTVAWAYRKVLGITGMSYSSGAQSKDSRFVTVYRSGINLDGSGTGSYDLSRMQPGDIIYYRRFSDGAKRNAYHIGHTEMYAGNGMRIGHGGGPNGKTMGPSLKTITNDASNIVMVRRLAAFVNGTTPTIQDDIGSANYGDTGEYSTASEALPGSRLLSNLSTAISGYGSLYDNILQPLLTGDPSAGGSTDTTGSSSNNTNTSYTATNTASISGGSTEQKVWNYLKSKGLPNAAIAGVMGNLYAESGIKSNNLQNSGNKSLGMTDAQYTSAVNSGTYKNFSSDDIGYGLAQWTSGGRKAQLQSFAKDRGKSIDDLGTQLDYLWYELQNGWKNSVLSPIKKASSVKDASTLFLQKYEAPDTKYKPNVIDARAKYAQGYYDLYNGQFGAGPGLAATSNVNALTDKVRSMNQLITTTKNNSATESTVSAISRQISSALNGNKTETGSSSSLDKIANLMAVMVDLLTSIKDNTAEDTTTSTPTSNPLPKAIANDTGNTVENVGSAIINRLTSK